MSDDREADIAERFRATMIRHMAASLPEHQRASFLAWTEDQMTDDAYWRPIVEGIPPIPVMSQDDFERMRWPALDATELQP